MSGVLRPRLSKPLTNVRQHPPFAASPGRAPNARLPLVMGGLLAATAIGGCTSPPPRIEFASLPPGWTHEDADEPQADGSIANTAPRAGF